MDSEKISHNSPSSTDSDATVYKEVLQRVADVLRATDFTTFLGGITFVMEMAKETYDPDSNDRSVERSSDVVTALSYLALLLLEQMDDPNEVAKLMGERVEQEVQEYSEWPPPNLIPQEEFSQMLESIPHYSMSLEEFFQIIDLPSDEMFCLIDAMIKLDSVKGVESLFTEE